MLEGERREFEAACAKYGQEKQAVMEQVQARRDIVRGVVEAGVLPAAESPARFSLRLSSEDVDCKRVTVLLALFLDGFKLPLTRELPLWDPMCGESMPAPRTSVMAMPSCKCIW